MRISRLVLPLLVLACLASAGTINYDISILFNNGPLNGQTGSGSLSFDDTLIQHVGGFNFVAPNGHGLLSLQITAVGQTLDMSTAVNYPTFPVLYLDASNVPGNLFALWGNTTSQNDIGYLIGGTLLQYGTQVNSLIAIQNPNGSTNSGGSFGQNDQQSYAYISFQQSQAQAPEPASVALMSIAATGLLVFHRSSRRRNQTP